MTRIVKFCLFVYQSTSWALTASVAKYARNGSASIPHAEYVVGSEEGWSDLKTFTAMKAGTDWSPSIAVFGDLGLENARSLER